MQISMQNISAMAEECKRQQSGEESVYWLITAWEHIRTEAYLIGGQPTYSMALELAALVEPVKNAQGFRKVPIMIDGMVQGCPPGSISHAVDSLMESYGEGLLSPSELYQELESIHPWNDGNGRVGFLLYNWDAILLGGDLAVPPMYVKNYEHSEN